jgi:hypothetical protein
MIAPASGHVEMLRDFADQLTEPLWLLYVLIVSRTDKNPGRYQIPGPITRGELNAFLNQYQHYLERDGRHHLWIGADDDSGLLIYDRHNVIFAYGPLQTYVAALEHKGFSRVERIDYPVPHTHQYNPEFDLDEAQLLQHWKWKHFTLQPQDDP